MEYTKAKKLAREIVAVSNTTGRDGRSIYKAQYVGSDKWVRIRAMLFICARERPGVRHVNLNQNRP